MDDLYTEDVKKLMYQFKEKLPQDFPLTTVERAIYSEEHDTIIIPVDAKYYDWRTAEDKLQIISVLIGLRNAIRDKGVPCLIEKPGHEQSTFQN